MVSPRPRFPRGLFVFASRKQSSEGPAKEDV
jgi:hypothetical protein